MTAHRSTRVEAKLALRARRAEKAATRAKLTFRDPGTGETVTVTQLRDQWVTGYREVFGVNPVDDVIARVVNALKRVAEAAYPPAPVVWALIEWTRLDAQAATEGRAQPAPEIIPRLAQQYLIRTRSPVREALDQTANALDAMIREASDESEREEDISW